MRVEGRNGRAGGRDPIWDPASTVAALRLVPVDASQAGRLCVLIENHGVYTYDPDSEDADDEDAFIAPAAAPGNWRKIGLASGAGSGDVLSAGKSGGQSIQGTSNASGTLTLTPGGSDPVFVDGDLDADGTISASFVRTGDLIMEHKGRGARWRFVEYREYVEARNEITGETQHLAILHPAVIPLLNRVGRLISRLTSWRQK